MKSLTESASLLSSSARREVVAIDRFFLQASRHWMMAVGFLLGIYVGLPFLAPVFMHLGWTGAGNAIYTLYSTQCHQLPERSFFLFGPRGMYSLKTIQAVFADTNDPFILRRFVGNASLGWKVAWSDRMVSMYTSTLLFASLWWPWRKRIKALPWWGMILLLLPMAVDGGTHFLSDLAGIGQGFRDSNLWLTALTQNALPSWFYAGDALGSFNSWMRILTGILFGLGVAWFGFPYLEASFSELVTTLEDRFRQAGLAL